MARQLDVLFVQPNSSVIYQELRGKYSCIETPTWALLLAQSCRKAGFGADILDCDAHNISNEVAISFIQLLDPRLVVFVVYGSEPNQGTTRMASAVPLAQLLKERYPGIKVCFTGSHTQALPKEVLALPCVDFVLLNEGVYALRNLLGTDLGNDLWKVKGIGWKPWGDKGEGVLNDPEHVVPQNLLDQDLPGYAWDSLINMKSYRCHFWHGQYQHDKRSPSAALYTSLGCFAKCSYCMINLINRINNSPGTTAADSPVFRYWSADHTLKQIEALVNLGVTTIRFSDEMFFLNKNHYEPLLTGIKERWGDSLNLWAYARVDTVRPKYLELFRAAGVRWLCLGIESANQTIRREVSKGTFQEINIREVVKQIEDADIDVLANYIFGLPNDTYTTMQQTLDLSIELNTRMWNAYPGMALPGTPLYEEAKSKKKPLPESYSGFGFLSYDCVPLGTDTLLPADVLSFRDNAFHTYWSRPEFHAKVEQKFGVSAVDNIKEMLQVKLKRKLLGD